MKILICNDDGINSEGIKALANRLSEKNEILVVAPDGNRSGFSHSLTFDRPLVLKKVFLSDNYNAYSFSGTPVDCVKFSLDYFKDFIPDLVVGGINNGCNIGTDVLYSGTVAVALEATVLGHKAMAFSLAERNADDFSDVAEYASNIIDEYYDCLSEGFILNVNIPFTNLEKIKGTKLTPLGVQIYTDRYVKQDDETFILVGEPSHHDKNVDDCDVEWIKRGYTTVTPIVLDKTDFTTLQGIKKEKGI